MSHLDPLFQPVFYFLPIQRWPERICFLFAFIALDSTKHSGITTAGSLVIWVISNLAFSVLWFELIMVAAFVDDRLQRTQ
jgi:hypothetical protein